jgi:alpha-L-fucosidase
MENAKLKIDIMKELSEACKKNDIMFGSYYSNLDWYHPDWHPYQHGGPGELFEVYDDTPNIDRYFEYMENQVIELIEKYDVDFLQFDGEWDSTYTHEVGSGLYRRFHEIKPEILINSRIDVGRNHAEGHGNLDGEKFCGDFQERERITFLNNDVLGWLDHPWQAWVTLDKKQWSYRPNPDLIMLDELILDLVNVIGNNGNYMINLGPRPDGNFDPEQVELMNHFGDWIKKHSETIYKTRGGPFYPFPEGVSTRKGKKAWLFITDLKTEKLELGNVNQKLKSAKVFGTKTKVPFKLQENKIGLDLTAIAKEGPVCIIELEFDNKVEMQSSAL